MKGSNTVEKTLTFNNIYLLILFALFVIAGNSLYSYPNGVSGFTNKTGSTAGCGTCHGTGANSLISVAISGPSALKPGEIGNYSVTISGGGGSAVGVDIAASNGTLVNSDNNLKVLNGELTHPSKKSFSGGKYTFNFKYTAPSTAGKQTLYAAGESTKPEWNFAPAFNVNVQNTTDLKDQNSAVNSYSLQQNYPNPFNPATSISYSLPKQSSVKLVVFNSIGQEVATLVNSVQSAGNYQVSFNASNLSSGIYFYSIDAKAADGDESFKYIRKMSLLK
ncbi:MAG: choice-of-anchor V domain-containing protein [Bacillota bacterium]